MTETAPANASDRRAPHLTHSPYERREELRDLAAIVVDALAFTPPLYPSSILGHPWTWIPPHPRTSEFSVVNAQQLLRSFQYLSEVTIPAVPLSLPENLPGIGNAVFFRPTTVLFEPGLNDDPYLFPEEAWIFINGVATNEAMARINAEYLVSLFHRPLTIIQNASDSIAVDLFECVLGKAWEVNTEAAAKAYPFVHRSLHHRDKKRVVVLCHSQGTIIMSNVLRALVNPDYRREVSAAARRARHLDVEVCFDPLEDLELLKKLEVYAFANCATVMAHLPGLRTARGNPAPWIENFGNEYDVVARCGMLAPRKEEHGIAIDGGTYVKSGGWGHLLNVHYLYGMQDHMSDPKQYGNDYRLQGDGGPSVSQRPRLYEYFDGRVPEPY